MLFNTASAQDFSDKIEQALEDMKARKEESFRSVIRLEEDKMEESRDLCEEFQAALLKENERYVEIAWQYLDRSGEMTEYHEGVIAAFRPWNVHSIRRGNLLAGSSTWRRAG